MCLAISSRARAISRISFSQVSPDTAETHWDCQIFLNTRAKTSAMSMRFFRRNRVNSLAKGTSPSHRRANSGCEWQRARISWLLKTWLEYPRQSSDSMVLGRYSGCCFRCSTTRGLFQSKRRTSSSMQIRRDDLSTQEVKSRGRLGTSLESRRRAFCCGCCSHDQQRSGAG